MFLCLKQVVIILLLFGCIACDYEFPEFQVTFYSGGGFQVSIPADPKISVISFQGEMNDNKSATWDKLLLTPTGGRFVFVQEDGEFKVGDRLKYRLQVIHDEQHYELSQEKEVKSLQSRPLSLKSTGHEFANPLVLVFRKLNNVFKIEFSIDADEGIQEVRFDGWLSGAIGRRKSQFTTTVRDAVDGRFVGSYSGTDLLSYGRVFYSVVTVNYKGIQHKMGSFKFTYHGSEDSTTYREMNKSSLQQTYWYHKRIPVSEWREKYALKQSLCPPSITVTNGQLVKCAGKEIFFDDFQDITLNTTKWKIERRIAMEPDYEFVLYSNQSITTGHGLRIEPKLLTEVYGENALRSDLTIDGCTGPRDSMACSFQRKRSGNTIAPPIVSSQVTTSGLFSFMYGRVEIEAKLPKGDWIYPQLWLQPQGDKYDQTDYRAGLITVVKKENYPSGICPVKQGVVLGAEEPLRSLFMAQRLMPKDWEKEFHKFIVDWRPEGISFWIGGQENHIANWTESASSIFGSDSWRNQPAPAPFDQEFFLALGLGVGGRNDFPMGNTPWDRTSPQMRREFMDMKYRWYPTWADDSKALVVKSVKVYAV